MKSKIVEETLKEIYDRIYHPNSACPDVEVGHVFNILVEILSKSLRDDLNLSKNESILLAQQKLFNQVDIGEYTSKVYKDPNWIYQTQEYIKDELDLAEMEFNEALQNLKNKQLL